jgi:hypothetical protein
MMANTETTRSMRVTFAILSGAVLSATLMLAFPARLAAQASKGVHVCLGTDNVLRFTSSDKCPQGQKMFRLAEVEDEVGVTKDRDDPPNAVVADLKTKVDFLTKRVANLEAEFKKVDTDSKTNSNTSAKTDPKIPTQVRAPFEVVDKTGKPIFVVADAPHAMVPRQGRIQIAQATTGDNNFSMIIRNASGKGVAGIGELTEGGGMYVGDAEGRTRVFASADNGLQVYNKNQSVVVHLKSGPGNAGQFWMYDEGGRAMVMAGTLGVDGGIGSVEVGPGRKCVPTGTLRVPDCIRGRPQ